MALALATRWEQDAWCVDVDEDVDEDMDMDVK